MTLGWGWEWPLSTLGWFGDWYSWTLSWAQEWWSWTLGELQNSQTLKSSVLISGAESSALPPRAWRTLAEPPELGIDCGCCDQGNGRAFLGWCDIVSGAFFILVSDM